MIVLAGKVVVQVMAKAKAKKKNIPQVAISQEESTQAQQALEQYHQLAVKLRAIRDLELVETALTEINALPEGVQLALVKELSKEKHVDAADVLTAINELGALKSVRKEAKRSLIRLEASRIYPQWQLPAKSRFIIVPPDDAMFRHFWKGLVTDSLDEGKVQLILCWEQGEDNEDVCVLGFLLDFTLAGVKDFFTRVESKDSFERSVARMIEEEGPELTFKSCSRSEGRRLLLEALEVNTLHDIKPHKDYLANLSLVNELVIKTSFFLGDEDDDDEEEESVDLHDLNPQEVVTTFVEKWANEYYHAAYDCLSQDSTMRAGLTKDEWVKLREDWAAEVAPARFESDFIFERISQKPKVWLPNLFPSNNSNTVLDRREVESAWSIEVDEIPLVSTLPELSEPTTIYKETGRHWFWLRYTLVQEDGVWLIQDIVDEATHAQTLSVDALRKQIDDIDKQMRKLAKGRAPEEMMQLAGEEISQIADDMLLLVFRATSYNDILIKKMPLERINYENGAGRMILSAHYERCLSYMLPIVELFPEDRAAYYRQIGKMYQRLGEEYEEEYLDERVDRCNELAENALRESLALEESFEAHISLAELLIERDDDALLDEVETHLLQAKSLAADAEEEAHVELHFGEVATMRKQFQKALSHYQRIIELQPTAKGWGDLGDTYQELDNLAEADAAYRRAIDLKPDTDVYYYTLSKMYGDAHELMRAKEVVEEGLRVHPDSSDLYLYRATNALDRQDYREAKEFIDEAARLNPDSEPIALFKQIFAVQDQLDQERLLTQPTKQPTRQPTTPRLLIAPSKQKKKKKR